MNKTIYTNKNNSLKRTRLWKNFQKNIKKDFPIFVAVPPGLSELAISEAKQKISAIKNLNQTTGGFSFNSDPKTILYANRMLGTPARILVRIGKFHADNFSQLIKECEKIPFELFLFNNLETDIKVAFRKSRLRHSKAIGERVLLAIKKRLDGNESIPSPRGMDKNSDIYIRISRDVATISVDSSGEPLYRRGVKKYVSEAPLRENIAFSGLSKLGFSKNFHLIDPMCGSGTFSIEGAMISNSIPPGYFRTFACEKWPLMLAGKGLEKNKDDEAPFTVKNIFTSDIDEKNIELLQQNIHGTILETKITVNCMDFFSLNPSIYKLEKKQTIVSLNPPYGIRLSKEKNLLPSIKKHLWKNFKGSALLMTIPQDMTDSYFSRRNFDCINFVHGGIDMAMLTGQL